MEYCRRQYTVRMEDGRNRKTCPASSSSTGIIPAKQTVPVDTSSVSAYARIIVVRCASTYLLWTQRIKTGHLLISASMGWTRRMR